jgi:hypothetical protein
MPRYVILEHDWPIRHWDFMLEVGDVLQTWRLPTAPAPNAEISAEKIFDHRLMYLDYEGPISGNRGSVTRWDGGSFEVVEEKSRARSKQDLIDCVIQLNGKRLHGTLEMKCGEGSNWTLRFS